VTSTKLPAHSQVWAAGEGISWAVPREQATSAIRSLSARAGRSGEGTAWASRSAETESRLQPFNQCWVSHISRGHWIWVAPGGCFVEAQGRLQLLVNLLQAWISMSGSCATSATGVLVNLALSTVECCLVMAESQRKQPKQKESRCFKGCWWDSSSLG